MNFQEIIETALANDDLTLLRDAVRNATASFVTEYDTLQNGNTRLQADITNKDATITELNTSIVDIKDLLGVNADIPLNKELIKSKLNGGKDLDLIEDKYNSMITTINSNHAEKVAVLENTIKNSNDTIYSLTLDNKITTLLPHINANDGAMDDIKRYIKDGAIIKENGQIAYKDGDILVRNSKGFELTIDDRLDDIKKDRAYLFKTNVQGGGNLPNVTNTTSTNNRGLTAFGQRMEARAKTNRAY